MLCIDRLIFLGYFAGLIGLAEINCGDSHLICYKILFFFENIKESFIFVQLQEKF